MNKQAAKAMTWTREDLREYLGLGKGGLCPYLLGRPFCPGIGPLSITCPKQLHDTKRHKGVYVNMDASGCPDLRKDVVAMLDGIPHSMISDALKRLRDFDNDAYLALNACWRRLRREPMEMVASQLNITRSALYKRLDRVIETVSDYLDGEMGKVVGGEIE